LTSPLFPYTTLFRSDFDGGNDGGEECPDVRGKPQGASAAFTSPAIKNSRFYSIKLFDAPAYSLRPRLTTNSGGAGAGLYNQNTRSEEHTSELQSRFD